MTLTNAAIAASRVASLALQAAPNIASVTQTNQATQINFTPSGSCWNHDMAVTPSPASSVTRGASLSAKEVKKAVEPYEADQDEIDRDNIVQQPRHEQN